MNSPRAMVIVSGGQTGADRAALDFALRHGFPHRGWCPAGRLAEDGRLEDCYRLQETPSPAYAQRTEWNVRDSDGTVIFTCHAELSGGTLFTWECARKLGRPVLVLVAGQTPSPARALRAFLRRHRIRVLNVAGPRASFAPGIGAFVEAVLSEALLPRRKAGLPPSAARQ
ncbi:MAG: putative molybdenum carrier protein [Verrucomicrobiae bacterium]|nr:putative molybdenum carrier protein [Verrucomicrobiae bacterium]